MCVGVAFQSSKLENIFEKFARGRSAKISCHTVFTRKENVCHWFFLVVCDKPMLLIFFVLFFTVYFVVFVFRYCRYHVL